jgi:hypothetical protein
MAAAYHLRPVQQAASLEFKLRFTGVDSYVYPNGLRFSPADLWATPILEEVYRRHQLEGRIAFEDFLHAFAIVPHNPALNEFRREFRGRLEDSGLNQVQRIRLEDDYALRIRALRTAAFTMVARLPDGWPRDLAPALLEDVLAAWARRAREQSFFRFDFDIYSANITAGTKRYRDDYLALMDRFRITIDSIRDNLGVLEGVPGAMLVRAGPKQMTIAEMQAIVRPWNDPWNVIIRWRPLAEP